MFSGVWGAIARCPPLRQPMPDGDEIEHPLQKGVRVYVRLRRLAGNSLRRFTRNHWCSQGGGGRGGRKGAQPGHSPHQRPPPTTRKGGQHVFRPHPDASRALLGKAGPLSPFCPFWPRLNTFDSVRSFSSPKGPF